MKIYVLTDDSGKIIATRAPAGKPRKGEPTRVMMRPTEGQQLHEVEVPEHLRGKLISLHHGYFVAVGERGARLIDRTST